MSGDQKRDEALTGLLGAVSGATAGREDPSALIQALQRALERLPGARVAFSHRDAAWARREFGIDGAPSGAVQDALCAAAENFGPDDEPDLRYLVEDHLRLAGAKAAYEDEPGADAVLRGTGVADILGKTTSQSFAPRRLTLSPLRLTVRRGN